MAVKKRKDPNLPLSDEPYGLRLFIREIAARRGNKHFIPRAIAVSLAFHFCCMFYYLFFYTSPAISPEMLRIKTGDPRFASQNIPHEKKPSVAVGIVKEAPKKPEPTPPQKLPEGPKYNPSVWHKPVPPAPLPVQAVVPKPAPAPLPQPLPEAVAKQPASMPMPQPLELPPTAPLPVPQEVQGPPMPVPGAQVAGYEHGTDTLAAQEQPENYVDKLSAYIHQFFVYPDIAREERLSGTVTLRVELDRNGTILRYEFLKRSGEAILDIAVEQMMARANPVPAIPPEEQSTLFDLNYNLTITTKDENILNLLPQLP